MVYIIKMLLVALQSIFSIITLSKINISTSRLRFLYYYIEANK